MNSEAKKEFPVTLLHERVAEALRQLRRKHWGEKMLRILPKMEAIVDCVGRAHGFSAEEVLERKHRDSTRWPKQLAALLIKETCPGISPLSIGLFFGLNHPSEASIKSIVYHRMRVVRSEIYVNPEREREVTLWLNFLKEREADGTPVPEPKRQAARREIVREGFERLRRFNRELEDEIERELAR